MLQRCLERRLAATQPPLTPPLIDRMDGSTSAKERQSKVQRFNAHTGPAVLFVSLEACAVGVNLHTATRAILVRHLGSVGRSDSASPCAIADLHTAMCANLLRLVAAFFCWLQHILVHRSGLELGIVLH